MESAGTSSSSEDGIECICASPGRGGEDGVKAGNGVGVGSEDVEVEGVYDANHNHLVGV